MVKKASKPKNEEGVFVFSVDGLTFNIPKGANLPKDVLALVTVFLVRGNNLFKILKTVSKDAKMALSSKMALYGIKSDDDADAAARRRKERVILSSKDITLSRIAASFPQITLAVAKSSNIKGKANLMAIKECYKQACADTTTEMPTVLQHGLIPALLSKSEPQDQSNLLEFCYMFNLEQSMTLQPPNVKKTMMQEPLSTHIENSMKFVQAAINGPLTDDNERYLMVKSLITDDTAIKNWIDAGGQLLGLELQQRQLIPC